MIWHGNGSADQNGSATGAGGPMIVRSTSASDCMAKIRALVLAERPTYHVQEHRGARILYDLCSGSLMGLDAATYALLSMLERGAADEQVLDAVDLAGGVDLPALTVQLRELKELGLFHLERAETADGRRAVLEALNRHRPRNLMLMVHTSCNLACDYCYEVISGFHHTGGAMSFERAKVIIDDYLERSGGRKAVIVTFFGGEPLLNFEVIRRVVAYCDRRGPELGKEIGWSMTTNATLLTGEIISFVVAHRFALMVSLDGDPKKADIHRHDRAGRGATERALEGARRLVAAQRSAGLPEASIRVTLTEENSSGLEARAYLRAQGFQRVMIGEAGGRAHHKNAWDLTDATIEGLHGEHAHMVNEHLRAIDQGERSIYSGDLEQALQRSLERLRAPSPSDTIGCGVGRNMLAVAADGKQYPCHRFAGESNFVIGDIRQGGIDKDRLDEFYRGILDAQKAACSQCWARFLCGGRCPWYLANPDGSISPPDEAGCDHLRAGFEQRIWLHKESLERETAHGPNAPRSNE